MKEVQEKNVTCIHARLEHGLSLLREYYQVEEYPVDSLLSNPVIGGRPHHARRFDIKGVGNLLLMTVTEAEENQLSSFVIMPYYKNLPLFSTDYVYSGEKRFFLLEIYDLSVEQDDDFRKGIEAFSDFEKELAEMQDIPTRSAWYDDIRPICYAKAPELSQDDLAIRKFLEFLKLFIEMEQTAPVLKDSNLMEKWKKNKEYADRLIDEGGVSTDLFTQALGAENTRRFFHEIFFGADFYKPQKNLISQILQIERFMDIRDSHGLSNREKIKKNQHIIRRIPTTDKSKSYEDTGKITEEGVFPPGVVIQDGRLIGFGIHIFNEDIYPIQNFEIYLRKCELTGQLDLSGCENLLFVDLYHNGITGINVAGAKMLRILGLQDNRIEKLDIKDLAFCQGIDAGMNRLQTLDVSRNSELVELYINNNQFSEINLKPCPKLKYFYCHKNRIEKLDTTGNPMLRHLNATENPMKEILSLAPQRDEHLPLTLRAEGPGTVGLKYNPVYDAQWKETGEWQQTYYAYPQEGASFTGWFNSQGEQLSMESQWMDKYGASRVLTARFR